MDLKDYWKKKLNKEYWIVYPPPYPFENNRYYGIDLNDKLIILKFLMNYGRKDRSITSDFPDLYNIIHNTKRWKFICYKIQSLYNESIYDINVKSHLLRSLKLKLNLLTDYCKSEDSYGDAIRIRDVIKELIHIYVEFSFDINELCEIMDKLNEYQFRRLAKIFEVAWKKYHNITFEFITEVLCDITKKIYYREIIKSELPENILIEDEEA